MAKTYETVLGLEVHVELATRTKIFCGCPASFGGVPNAHTCPVCMGMPGALPVLNKQVVTYALAVGLASNCTINQHCRFDRKNYFYPDNPQNYQISQLYEPICRDGGIEIPLADGGTKRIGIHEIHMEEDAGKLIHDEAEGISIVDFNRAGVPLLEIVSEPDLRSAEEVLCFLEQLRLLIHYVGASDCKLNEGSMRVDVNLSVRECGSSVYGTRTEMKNLNSFHAIARAIEHERNRQIALLENGQSIEQETRRWDDAGGCSYSMRTKEAAQDYRYFPEPDLVQLVISDEWIDAVRQRQPELPAQKLARYEQEYGLPRYDAEILVGIKPLAELFEQTTALCGKPKKVSNWLMGETMRLLNERGLAPEQISFSPDHLAALVNLADAGTINSSVAKEVFEKLFTDDIEPEVYVRVHGLDSVNDADMLRAAAAQVIREHPQSVADYCGGKERALGFLVGQTMKAMQGKANPSLVHEILRELLNGQDIEK